jgi:hypothetical protein
MEPSSENVKALAKYCPAAFYHPNKPAPDNWIIRMGGSPGTRSRGDAVWFESDAPTRVSIGGNRAGKTTKLVLEVGSSCIGCRPWYSPDSPWFTRGLLSERQLKAKSEDGTVLPPKWKYTLPSFAHHLREVTDEFAKWWPKEWYTVCDRDDRGAAREFRWFNGATVTFFSHYMDPSDYEGTEFDGNAYDEPPPKPIWAGSERGLVSTGGRSIVGATLLDASGWFWEEIVNKAEQDQTGRIFVTWHSGWDNTYENGGCRSQTVKNLLAWLEDKVTDPDERLAREHGHPMSVGGLVLGGLNRTRDFCEPIELPPDCIIVSGIDPAGAKPMAALHVAYMLDPDGKLPWIGHIFDETWMPESKNDLGAFARTFTEKDMGRWEPFHPVPSSYTVIDPVANEHQKADVAGRTLKQILAMDYGIETTEANRSGKRARLMDLNSKCKAGHYKVWPNCRRFMQERSQWTWDPASPKLTKGSDDISDALSYIHSTSPWMLLGKGVGNSAGIYVDDRHKGGYGKGWLKSPQNRRLPIHSST